MSTSSQSYPMSGGDGQHSYIHNSSYQKAAIDGAEEKTRQCILEKLDLQNSNSDLSTFRIADFGCSIGPNTFHVVQTITDTVKLKQMKESNENSLVGPLDFLLFFNDQPNNDFNTLFTTQPPSTERGYFSVGVPGSFHGRVLPKNIIHIGHTSYTIHWLSKVPENVCDKNSLAWNKSYIHCNNLIEEVTKAYNVQFMKDIGVFLEARAEEIAHGGLMIVLGQCLPDGVSMFETWQGVVLDMIGDCLMDMTKSGVTSEEKIELFSLPQYFPEFSELERAMKQNKSLTIEMMEIISHPLEDIPLSTNFITSTFRAFLESIINEHFGEGLVDELFERLAKKLIKYSIDFKDCQKQVDYFILLKRKMNGVIIT